MKLRKIMAVALAAALGVGSALPAMAVETAGGEDQALMAVTAKVKDTLGLDTEVFTDFQGHAQEDVLLGKRWSLEWDGDGVMLHITADDNGKIYSYNRTDVASDEPDWVVESRYFGGKMNIPRLPEDKSGAAYDAAKAFVGKVLEAPVETLEMENQYSPSLQQSTYRYSGKILLNGLSSPIDCSVSVRASDLTVTRFWRGDEGAGYLNGVSAVANNTTAAQARTALQGTLEFEAQFVLDDQGKTAHVRYVPLYRDDYYVDGETGKLVNLTELRQKLWSEGGANRVYKDFATDEAEAPEAAAGMMNGSLTQAEKDGAAILEGALSKEALDKAVQNAWPEFGLSGYTLSGASYSIAKKDLPEGQEPTSEDYDITCRLTYGKQENQVLRNKYVNVDAKTGVVKSLWSRRYFQGDKEETLRYAITLANAQPKAEAVLKSFAGEHFDALALAASTDAQVVDRHDWQHTYTFQQKAGDWFYSGNSYTVGVDATDGTISLLEGSFDPEVELVVPKSIVSPAAAAAAYAGAMDLPFAYLEVPVSISLAGSEVMPLLKEAGYSYVMALKTGYTLTQPKDKYVRGVDAESGQAIVDTYENVPDNAITYDDLEGHWVKQAAEELAVFDIGLRGGSLKPQETLTQLDMIALLMSVEGYSYDPATATKDETDWLYERAYSLGLVTPETRGEAKAVTRGELVKLILDSAGYQRIAALVGIFRCDFADSAGISSADIGYAALAQGLGLVKGGPDGAYAAGREATRGEAVAMLYQYMK